MFLLAIATWIVCDCHFGMYMIASTFSKVFFCRLLIFTSFPAGIFQSSFAFSSQYFLFFLFV